MVNCGVMKVHWNLGDVTISDVIKKQCWESWKPEKKDAYKQIEIFDFELFLYIQSMNTKISSCLQRVETQRF